jgi:hypothetical protein
VEAFNKTLSKRYNMFNSAGNKGRLGKDEGGIQVQPFELLGKWMARYVMWQLGYANNLFIGKCEVLGPTQIAWDVTTACFIGQLEGAHDDDAEDDYYCSSDGDDSDSDLDAPFTQEDNDLCTQAIEAESRLTPRKRGYDTLIIA